MIDYIPIAHRGMNISTPEEQGLRARLVDELYFTAQDLETLQSILIVKNGSLIAEDYFNQGALDQYSPRQSITKSVTSSLVGIALEQGLLSSLNQRMIDFFPEYSELLVGTNKDQITIGDLMKMRSGYIWDRRSPHHYDLLFSGNGHWLKHLVDFPLQNHPGKEFQYSNLSSHILAIIVSRVCGTDLRSFAQKNLFTPMGSEVGDWGSDGDNYNWGWGEISLTARTMAQFGLLYLNRGFTCETQVVPGAFVDESLEAYSKNIPFSPRTPGKIGRHMVELGYGYQWWSAKAGEHSFHFAWGLGGQLIVLLHQLNMVIVTTGDALKGMSDQESWKHEGKIFDMVGAFIKSISIIPK